MASEVDHRPPEPETATTKAPDNAGATATGKPAAPPPPGPVVTAGFVPLFPDTTTASDTSGADDDSDSATATTTTTSRAMSPVTSPPYWQLLHTTTTTSTNPGDDNNNPGSSSRGRSRPGTSSPGGGTGGHARTASAESVLSDEAGSDAAAAIITLRDNEEEGASSPEAGVRNSACWARSVEVVSHVVVNGSATNIGAFVVWNIRVETLSGSFMNIRKRYSEFDDFRRRLVQTFPGFEAAVPALPPKSVISKFRPRFLEKRRAGLQYFLHCIMLNPEFSGSPVLKEFLFS